MMKMVTRSMGTQMTELADLCLLRVLKSLKARRSDVATHWIAVLHGICAASRLMAAQRLVTPEVLAHINRRERRAIAVIADSVSGVATKRGRLPRNVSKAYERFKEQAEMVGLA